MGNFSSIGSPMISSLIGSLLSRSIFSICLFSSILVSFFGEQFILSFFLSFSAFSPE
ncbi:unnamed protein product [Meloidogyne enterolobii]|uniref:Uncharacterized protein n=1 Tax=Meloidogyne enterolobii TaxID=390850 RepID=A0ACB0ZFD6_MELEN